MIQAIHNIIADGVTMFILFELYKIKKENNAR